MRFPGQSLKWKILLITIAVVLLFQTIFGVETYLWIKSKEYRHLDANIASSIQDTLMTVRDPIYNFDKVTVLQLVDIHLTGGNFLEAVLLYQEENGSEEVYVDRAKTSGGGIRDIAAKPAGEYYRVVERDILKEDHPIGRAVLFFTDKAIKDTMASLLFNAILVVQFFVLLLVAALYIGLNRIITRPLLDITRNVEAAADGAGRGEESAGISRLFSARKDEIGGLHRAMERLFDERTKELARAYGALKLANEELGREIHERKQAEQELKAAKDQAEEATKLKDKFVSLVSHDLRSPLSNLIGYVQLIEVKCEKTMDESAMAMLGKAKRCGNHMFTLIEELLNISRLKSGKIIPKYNFFDARLMALQIISTFSGPAFHKGIAIQNNIHPNNRFYADRVLLYEVIQNLVANAVKFCREGDEISIGVSNAAPSTIVVSDTGIGIAPERQKILFNYETAKSTPGTAGERGHGFGLSLARDIVEAHGGELSVESTLGKGSSFFVRLPLVRPLVMIVDDEAETREIFAEHLKMIGLDILQAGNGQEALALLEANTVHLILTDLNMPGLDGFGLLEKVQGRHDSPPPRDCYHRVRQY